MATVKLYWPLGTQIQTANSGNVSPASDGTVTVNTADVPTLLAAGASFLTSVHRAYQTGIAVAATAGLTFASAALANGTLAVAAQPDIPRPLQAIVLPGTTAIGAGNLAITYSASDGTTAQVDNFALATAASTNLTLNTSKGVETVTSQVVTGLSGGASPTVYIGTTAAIALPVDTGAIDVTVTKEQHATTSATAMANASIGTASTTQLGCITPSSNPNGTLVFGYTYNYLTPNV